MEKQNYLNVWPDANWAVSSPEEQGMDQLLLAEMNQHAQQAHSKFRAILVIRHGTLVFEHYYHGQPQHEFHRIASVTKSIMSALVGIAMKEGYITDLDQPLVAFFPEYASFTRDAHKQEITLRHLLTMTSGLVYDERQDYVIRWDEGGDQWAQFALALPMVRKPGEIFQYNSLGAHLLSIILTRLTRMSTLDFARRFLFGPLGISTDEQAGFAWMHDSQGYYRGGGGMRLRARDMARFGYFYLRGGQWQGKQIVSSVYHEQTTHQHNAGGPPVQEAYGYLWWVTTYLGYHTYFASGIGGQVVAVVPDLDLVTVVLSVNQLNPEERHQREILPQFIIPSIIGKR